MTVESDLDQVRLNTFPVLAVAVRWLATEPSVSTRRAYAGALGLPHVAFRLGWCADVDELAAECGISVRCNAPTDRAHAPHLTWLAYTLGRALDPLDCAVCDDYAPRWAREMREWRGFGGEVLERSTRSVRVNAARKFYAYAMRKPGLACCNPFTGWRNAQLGLRVSESADGRVLKRDQRMMFQVAADHYRGAGPWYRARAAALVAILNDTGMRLEELRMTDVRDFVPSSPSGPCTLLIRDGKGGVRRRVTLGAVAEERIGWWLNDHRPEVLLPGADGRVPLLASKPRRNTAYMPGSGRMTREMVENTLRVVARESGFPALVEASRWVTVHAFRAALLTNGFDDGESAQDLAAFIGHRSVNTTTAYDRRRAQRGFRMAEKVTRANTRGLRSAYRELRGC